MRRRPHLLQALAGAAAGSFGLRAAALDVPAGMSTVSAEAPGAVSLASTPVTVRAGALTLVLLFPGP